MGEQQQLFDAPTPGGQSSAIISTCAVYRYRLDRVWDYTKPQAAWVLCNPSTADAREDDPTIRKCKGFAERWGCGGITVVNVCAMRSTDPKLLTVAPDPVGPDNREHFYRICEDYHFHRANGHGGASVVVVGWGGALPRALEEHVETALGWLQGVPLYCLGWTRHGRPKHPLMLPYSTPRQRYDGPMEGAHYGWDTEGGTG